MSVLKLMHYATIVAVLVAANHVVARAADPDSNNPAAPVADSPTPPAEKALVKKPAVSSARGPVASAFVLPHGVTLNPGQQAAYDQLKADKEPELRQAIDDLQSAKGNSVTQAAKKVRDTRAAIRKAINDIVSGAGPASPGASQQSKAGGPEGSGSGSYSAQYGGNPAQENGRGYGSGGYYPSQSYGGYYPYPNNNYSGKSGDGQSKSYSGGSGGTSGSTSVPGKGNTSGSSMSNGTSNGRSYPPSRPSYSRPNGGSSTSRH